LCRPGHERRTRKENIKKEDNKKVEDICIVVIWVMAL
jgi:hypothetical protein